MDVDRLGLMAVVGQPKQNSEYIQATSRVGRKYPGIIFTVYNPYRPRDLSNYENFVGFHSQMYRYVEGTTATPFAARARDRVLHALVVAMLRLQTETNHPQRPNAIKKICKKKIVPSQRGASNVYFPVTRTAISIPPWTNPINDLMAEHRRDIDLLIEVLERDDGLNKSYEKYFEGKFTRDEFNEAYNRLEQNIKDYVELKEMEYNAITHHQQVEFQHDVRYFKAEEVAIKDSLKKYFSRVIKLHRLREVKVLLGYSRLEMPEPEVDDQKQVVKLKSSGPEKWLPAVEINGEGIFIEFNRATMNEWLTNSRVAERSKKYERLLVCTGSYSSLYILTFNYQINI